MSAAVQLSRDAIALDMMREYSALCAACAHEPSAERFAAADEKRNAILRHAEQQERAIDAAIKALVDSAVEVGRFAGASPHLDAAQNRCEAREAELRAILGVS